MAQYLSNLPIGASIKFGKHQVGSETPESIIWVVADKNHSGYPSNSVTLVAKKIIDLRAYDGGETGGGNGNGNYSLSNINQWLNSSATAGNWYSATHSSDAPPTSSNTLYGGGYQSRPGFLYNFTTAERDALLPTTLTIQMDSDVSNKSVAKVFLLSTWEILGTGSVVDGSSKLSYFTSNSATRVLTNQAYNNTASTEKPSSITGMWMYWTRSTLSSKPCYIKDDGGSSARQANYGAVGVLPAVNLASTTKISDTTDSDGCYTFIANNAPTISGSNGDLGIKKDDFTTSYIINDGDKDVVTVVEYIDNVVIRSYVATLGTTNNFNINGVTWLKLTNGIHTLKIEATDGFNTATRVYTFTKSVDKIVVQRSVPIASISRPSQIIVTVVKTIPYKAIMTVEVCNNGFDDKPAWENIGTSSISSGLAYEFQNKVCESEKWGVNIRVTVDRNGGEGACYITEIGGNFE